MTRALSGGCLCGHVRYACSGDPRDANYCHCTDCKRSTGSAFNVGVRVRAGALQLIAGRVKGYTKTADSGSAITREFCAECGSPLFTRSPAHPEFVFIKAGSLDDPETIRPTFQIWTDRAVNWAHIDGELPSYPGNRSPAGKGDR